MESSKLASFLVNREVRAIQNLVKPRKNTFKLSHLVLVYVALVGLWTVSWLIVGDANWWLTLLNRLAPYLFLPVPVLFFLTLRIRRFKLVLPLLVPTLVFGTLYYPYLLPKPAPAVNTADLSVMTYNILFSNEQYDAIANVILTNQPDLIALQEVQPDMMAFLEEQLEAEYPYSQMGSGNQYGTTAVFSRHQILDSYVLDLKADRPAVVVKTVIHKRPVTFISAHLLAYGLWWVDWPDIPTVVMERTAGRSKSASPDTG